MATPARRLTFIHAVRKPFAEPQGTLADVYRRRHVGRADAEHATLRARPGLDRGRPDRRVRGTIATTTSPSATTTSVAARAHRQGRRRPRRDRGPALRRHPPPARDLLDHRRQPVPPPVPQRRGRRPVPGARRAAWRSASRAPCGHRPRSCGRWSRRSGWTTSSQRGVVRRTRSGGILRVELARPWFLTGVGEQLAVLVERCEAARDPIWNTPTPARSLEAASFTGASVAATAAADGAAVTVAAYDPAFGGEWWAADVELAALAETSYRPFVRLAVAPVPAREPPRPGRLGQCH